MKFTLVPEYKFDRFDLISPEFLVSLGARGVLLDIDNTLEPYEHPNPGEHVLAWLKSLDGVGIRYAIVSNNNKDRVELFNKDIGIMGQQASPKRERLSKKKYWRTHE